MFCQECGTQMNDDALFCPKCGTKVVAPVAPESPSAPVQAANAQQAPVYAQPMNSNIITQPQGTAAKGNGGKIAIIVIVAVVLIAAVIGGCVLLFGNSSNGSNGSSFFDSNSAMWDTIPKIDYTDVEALEYHYDASLEGMVVDGYKLANPKVRIPDTIENEPVVAVNLKDYTITELLVPETVKMLSLNKETIQYANLPRDIQTDGTSTLYLRLEKYEFDSLSTFSESTLKAIYISKDLKEIPGACFNGCGGLGEISIPYGITNIGTSAFFECTSLETVVIPDSVESIGKDCFYNCSSITSVDIGKSVKEIGEGAFDECSALKTVVIPDSVLEIGKRSFYKCSSMTSVDIGKSVTEIGEEAFGECTALEKVVIPDSVIIIGDKCFSGCSDMRTVSIGKSVTSVGSDAFSNCTNLTSAIIHNSETQIAKYAFDKCENITVTYNDKTYSYDNIDDIYYQDTSYDIEPASGEEVEMPNLINMTWDEVLSLYAEFNLNPVLKYSTEYPKGVVMEQEIAPGETIRLHQAVKITISNGPETIEIADYTNMPIEEVAESLLQQDLKYEIIRQEDGNVPEGCIIRTNPAAHELVKPGTTVICYVSLGSYKEPTVVPSLKNLSLSGAEQRAKEYGIQLDVVYEPSNEVEKGRVIRQSIDATTVVEKNTVVQVVVSSGDIVDDTSNVGSSGTASDYQALTMWEVLPEIDYTPNNELITHYDEDLGGMVVDGYTGVSDKVRIPDIIGAYPVIYVNLSKDKITELIVPDTVQNLLFNKSTVRYINYPRYLKAETVSYAATMGDASVITYETTDVFKESVIEAVYISNEIRDIPNSCFISCRNLNNVYLPDSIETIGDEAFSGCSSLKTINIPKSVNTIGYGVFSYSGLTSITIPDSVSNIGDEHINYVFNECRDLTFVKLPESLDRIGGCMFQYCTSLETITIPKGITYIGANAFTGCTALSSLIIPENVEYVDMEAFNDCTSLNEIIVLNDTTRIHASALYRCDNVTVTYKGEKYTYKQWYDIFYPDYGRG